ncbi:MAG: ATP-binding protein [Actinobacteria bacterium]|nr:ATP-binding protein [Actinomycetota bacterium]
MRILLVGAGAVGECIAAIAKRRGFFDAMAVADYAEARAAEVVAKHGDQRFTPHPIDARDAHAVAAKARDVGADAVLNACDPRLNQAIFDGAFAAGANYLDMAMTPSVQHATEPYAKVGVPLGEYQLDRHAGWEAAGQLALVGMGVEPGMSDVFARYAADHLFSSIDEVAVRDGANLEVEGYAFAPTFSIWTTIEECLNPPLVYDKAHGGFFTTEPFSEPEVFDFPEGIGPLKCVNVEHEEVVLVPRWIDCNRVTFKYGLDDDFIEVLRVLHLVGLDRTDPVKVGNVEVSPRDVVAAALPDPAHLGDKMSGKTCAGTYVTGTGVDGKPRATYLYHVVDNADSMAEYGCQAVAWQTAINPVVALELLASGKWSGAGVLGPEAFDAVPFLDLLAEYGSPHGVEERSP